MSIKIHGLPSPSKYKQGWMKFPYQLHRTVHMYRSSYRELYINVCTIPDKNYSSHTHTPYLLVRRLIMFYYFITLITNITKYPTDDWLTTFPFVTSHIWPNNHQPETYTVVLSLILRFLNFIHPN